ncbi:hypothetical protein [Sorangium sp. So ce1389]|uniref:hypothetical protein n=1 Tax=Sorangium sp. So ce1389 TaxID=3133336 RepID=UPI003F6217DD
MNMIRVFIVALSCGAVLSGCVMSADEPADEPADEQAPSEGEIATAEAALTGRLAEYDIGDLTVRLIEATSVKSIAPSVSYTAPLGWKILGGGATVNWSGYGNLLYASYPASNRTWIASAKSHTRVDETTVTLRVAIAQLSDGSPIPDSDHVIVSSRTTDPSATPGISVARPSSAWMMTGGGARVDWRGYGVLLTGSYPDGATRWRATAKAHTEADDSGRITSYLIALKNSFLERVGATADVHICESEWAVTPSVTCFLDFGSRMIGGGARANWTGHGQLLTTSNFVDQYSWRAKSKAHDVEAHGTVTAFAIGLAPR